MSRWRYIGLGFILALASLALPMGNAAISNESQDPNSIVPAQFAADMEWSEQGNWHWVRESFSGENTTTGVAVSQPYFVATEVRTLSADDPCTDCMMLDGNRQGPPVVMGGPENERLRAAYENLDNGPRYKIADEGDETGEVWAAGAWYLNYNPTTDTFFSWTWIPASEADAVSMDPTQTETIAAEHPEYLTDVPEGSRVFPLATGTYTISQNFGCVAPDNGYASSPDCPPERPSFHDGTDFGADEGTPIYAAASGTVVYSGVESSSGSGNSVITLQHDGVNVAYRTEYLHWSQAFVEPGDYVHAGQPIAEVGSVGYSSGPHLHFAVKDAATGIAFDPIVWLESSVTPVASEISVNSGAVMNVLRWEPQMRAVAERHNVPIALLAAVMTVESSGNPNAISPAGAMGLMQVMPMHLERYGIPREMWLDPASNIDAGARYLAESLSNGASMQEAVARYFGEGCDVLGTCTGQYVTLVMSWHAYFSALFDGQPLPPVVDIPVTSPPPSEPASEVPEDEPESDPEATPETPDEPADEADENAEEPETPDEGNDGEGEEGETPQPEPTETPAATPEPEGSVETPTATPEPEQRDETPTVPEATATPTPEPEQEAVTPTAPEGADEGSEAGSQATPEPTPSEPEQTQSDGSDTEPQAEPTPTPEPTAESTEPASEPEPTPQPEVQKQRQSEPAEESQPVDPEPTPTPEPASGSPDPAPTQMTTNQSAEPEPGNDSAEQDQPTDETNLLDVDAVLKDIEDVTDELGGGDPDDPEGGETP